MLCRLGDVGFLWVRPDSGVFVGEGEQSCVQSLVFQNQGAECSTPAWVDLGRVDGVSRGLRVVVAGVVRARVCGCVAAENKEGHPFKTVTVLGACRILKASQPYHTRGLL